MKRCPQCGESKPLDAFYTTRSGRPSSWCKSCNNAASKASYERNREARNRRMSIVRRARLLGLTYDEYVALDGDPGENCSICGATPDDHRNGRYSNGSVKRRTKRLAVDHDHGTGAIRGFLCTHCNRGLGYADHDPDLLRAMADYLEEAAENPPPWTPLAPQKPGRKRKTHCVRGHPLEGEGANVYLRADGIRVCRPCSAQRAREARKAKKGNADAS